MEITMEGLQKKMCRIHWRWIQHVKVNVSIIAILAALQDQHLRNCRLCFLWNKKAMKPQTLCKPPSPICSCNFLPVAVPTIVCGMIPSNTTGLPSHSCQGFTTPWMSSAALTSGWDTWCAQLWVLSLSSCYFSSRSGLKCLWNVLSRDSIVKPTRNDAVPS